MNNVLQSLVQHVAKSVHITQPMMTNRQKVLQAIIRSPGMVVNIRHMVKNIWKITTQTAKGECNKYLLSTFCNIYATIRWHKYNFRWNNKITWWGPENIHWLGKNGNRWHSSREKMYLSICKKWCEECRSRYIQVCMWPRMWCGNVRRQLLQDYGLNLQKGGSSVPSPRRKLTANCWNKSYTK